MAGIANLQQTLQREIVHLNNEISQALSASADGAAEATKRLAALKKRLRQAERRLGELKRETDPNSAGQPTENLASFESAWESLTARQRFQLLRTLIERIEYDGSTGDIAITLNPNGLQSLIYRSDAHV